MTMENKEAFRKAMGLSDLDSSNDKIIKMKPKDFDDRKKIQDLDLSNNIWEKPDGPVLWAIEKPVVTNGGTINKCNMQVTVVSVSAMVPGGNTDGTNITDIPKEHFIPRKLASEWSLEKLFYSNSNPDKPHKGIYMATPTNHYDYEEYWMHVPSNIRNAVPTFIQKFLDQYAGGYAPGVLKEEHVSVHFTSLKCAYNQTQPLP